MLIWWVDLEVADPATGLRRSRYLMWPYWRYDSLNVLDNVVKLHELLAELARISAKCYAPAKFQDFTEYTEEHKPVIVAPVSAHQQDQPDKGKQESTRKDKYWQVLTRNGHIQVAARDLQTHLTADETEDLSLMMKESKDPDLSEMCFSKRRPDFRQTQAWTPDCGHQSLVEDLDK